MDSKLTVLKVERVRNGWIVSGYSQEHYRVGSFLPDGTHVARTPDQLADLLTRWATEQQQAA